MPHSSKKWIRPAEVAAAAKRREKENYRFRAFLKRRADPDVLDRQFLALHREIFPRYDCAKCRNCCTMMNAQIPDWEVERDAEYLGMTREDFISEHLKEDFGEWKETHLPCGFLAADGSCRLGECRPDSCKKFPYTDQPKRLESLFSFLNAVSVCPAAYEICEALKALYGFGRRYKNRDDDPVPDADGDELSFVAGYTSWGFPYGIEPDGSDETEVEEEDLPF